MTTPPKSGAAGETSTVQSTRQAQTAIDAVDRMAAFVDGLKKELRAYGDPDTVGRDVQKLQTYLNDILAAGFQVAHTMGIDWQPNLSEFQGGSAGR